MCYAKILLFSYPFIGDAIEIIDKKIEKRCKYSFYTLSPCEMEFDRIACLIEEKRYLQLLKSKVGKILKSFTKEERTLLEYKYFNNRPIGHFDYKSRNYFRKQIKVFEKFFAMLNEAGFTEEFYNLHYKKIPFIKSIAIRIEKRLVA